MRTRRRLTALAAAVLASTLIAVPALGQEPGDEDAAATTLRLTLGRILGEHAFLSIEVVRSGILGGDEFTAASEALSANSEELVSAIESIYGADAAAAFGQQWRDHIGYLVDYVRALEGGDPQAAALATDQLEQYVADFSALLASVVPSLPEPTVSGLIDEHVQQLQHVAAFDMSAYADVYPAVRETYAHMFAVGDGLASGIAERFPDRFPGREFAFSPATDLRVTLDRLFGEHTYLAALVMRAHLGLAADVEGAISGLEDNAAELESSLTDIYGPQAGRAFGEMWSSHVHNYVAYAEAVAAADSTARTSALDGLQHHGNEFSTFLADANPFVTPSDLETLVTDHTDSIVRQADLYAAADYAGAYEAGREAYLHAMDMGGVLAKAIAAQFPDRLPNAATHLSEPAPWALVGMMFIAAAALTAGALRSRPASPELKPSSVPPRHEGGRRRPG